MKFIKKNIESLLKLAGYKLQKINSSDNISKDFDRESFEIYQKVKEYTLLPPGRILSLIQSVKYIEDNDIEGDYVECGVYMGGSILTIALTLEKFYPSSRKKIWLYDTFSGMPLPSEYDVKSSFKSTDMLFKKQSAIDKIKKYNMTSVSSDWVKSPLETTKKNIFSRTKYNKNNFKFVKGKVESTIPRHIPKKIALLRLDTDFYESTKHELTHLYPNLEMNGILIIDDYGIWDGCKKAVNEYFTKRKIKIFLSRVDESCMSAIKIS